MERQLAAILSADVRGYSRLMGEDEEATIRTLTTYRTMMTHLIEQHRGRVVDAPGDNLLASFASAVDAVQGALAIQRELGTRNAQLPDHRQMEYRIGINVGDVIDDGERIYGDSVNIAARMESLAEGGGVCISGTVYDQIANKLALTYVSLGEQTVKNIKHPIRVYHVKAEAQPVPPESCPARSDAVIQTDHRAVPVSPRLTDRMYQRFQRIRSNGKGTIALVAIAIVVFVSTAVFTARSVRHASPPAAAVTSSATNGPQWVRQGDVVSLPRQTEQHRSMVTTQTQGRQGFPFVDRVGEQLGGYRESHALVVGISSSMGGWPSLPGVKADVQAVTQALEQQDFHVVVVMDPDVAALEQAYRDFIGTYGLVPDNRLLFYYAGSAYTVKPTYARKQEEDWIGYLVARDTPRPSIDPDGFHRRALSMERFASLAREIQARHALFVFDSCFSGAIAFALGRSHRNPPAPLEITPHITEPVRQFISAGTADQEVPDVSIFRRLFVEVLEGESEADQNGDGVVTGSELGQFLSEKVTIASRGTQTPQYGKMSDPRLNRGEFVVVQSRPASRKAAD
jgi:class 3 adenylate cyclase